MYLRRGKKSSWVEGKGQGYPSPNPSSRGSQSARESTERASLFAASRTARSKPHYLSPQISPRG